MKFIKYNSLIIIFLGTFTASFAQIGGLATYKFLSLSNSARMAGLGGAANPLLTDDPLFALTNPALLRGEMSRRVGIAHQFLFADASAGAVATAYELPNWKMTLLGGVQYATYGKFKGTDELGNTTNEFSANELAFKIGASRPISERLTVGINLAFVTSRLESYQSFGIATDIGGLYFNPEKQFGLSFLLRNAGIQLQSYVTEGGAAKELLPLDVQIGFTKKLKRAPFRFGILLHSLQRWDLRYPTPITQKVETLFGEQTTQTNRFKEEIDNFFLHTIWNIELLFGKNETMRLRVAYDHQRQREARLLNMTGTAGFSFGFGIKIKRFQLDYGTTRYHLVGGSQHVSILTHF